MKNACSRALSVAAVALVALLAVSAPAPAAGGYHRCSGGVNPDGSTGKYGFYRYIRARKVACRTARRVVYSFVMGRGEGRFRNRVEVVVKGRDWTCRARLIQGDPNPFERIVCKARGGRRVRFE